MAVAKINQGAGLPRRWAVPFAAYGVFVFACITLLHPTFIEMVSLWAGSSSWRHGFLVAPIALWMIYERRQDAPNPTPSVAATGFVFAAALLWLAGRATGIALVEQFAFVSILIAGAAAIFGTGAIRVYAFPLAFLYFMVPFGEVLIPALQTITAVSVAWMLNHAGVAATLNGFLMDTHNGAFNIAAACAGLNFLLAALMAAAVISHLWFAQWRKRIAFIATAAAAAIAANMLRVFLVIFLAGITPEEWRIASDHFVFGLAIYAAMIAILLAYGLRLADPSRKQGG